MKKITLTALVAAATLVACSNEGGESTTAALNNNIDSVSYAIGINSATGLKQQFSEGNMDAYMQGFKDALDSTDMLLATEEAQGVIQECMQKKQVIEEMTRVLYDVLNKKPESTYVVIDEVDTDNWGVGGKTLTEIRKKN